MAIGLIKDIDLTTEEKAEIDILVSNANATLRVKAELFGFDRGRLMRKEYIDRSKDKNLFDEETRNALDFLLSIELTIISCYAKIAKQLAVSFYSTNKSERPHLDECDYVQESTWAIFDAIYCYNGTTMFSTYCYSTVKKRLIAFVRGEEIHSGINRLVQSLRRSVREIMRNNLCRFDEAVSELRKTVDISCETEDMVRDACYNVKCMDREIDVREADPVEESDSVKALYKAVSEADFTPIQRRLIESYIKTGKRIDADLVANEINPTTGESYTRQALSQNWLKACEKIKFLYAA